MIVSMCLNGPSAQKSNIFLHLGGFYLGPFYCHHSMARTCLLYISNWIILFKTFKAHHGGMIVSSLFKTFKAHHVAMIVSRCLNGPSAPPGPPLRHHHHTRDQIFYSLFCFYNLLSYIYMPSVIEAVSRTTTQTSPPHQRLDLLFSFLLLQFTLVNTCHL